MVSPVLFRIITLGFVLALADCGRREVTSENQNVHLFGGQSSGKICVLILEASARQWIDLNIELPEMPGDNYVRVIEGRKRVRSYNRSNQMQRDSVSIRGHKATILYRGDPTRAHVNVSYKDCDVFTREHGTMEMNQSAWVISHCRFDVHESGKIILDLEIPPWFEVKVYDKEAAIIFQSATVPYTQRESVYTHRSYINVFVQNGTSPAYALMTSKVSNPQKSCGGMFDSQEPGDVVLSSDRFAHRSHTSCKWKITSADTLRIEIEVQVRTGNATITIDTDGHRIHSSNNTNRVRKRMDTNVVIVQTTDSRIDLFIRFSNKSYLNNETYFEPNTSAEILPPAQVTNRYVGLKWTFSTNNTFVFDIEFQSSYEGYLSFEGGPTFHEASFDIHARREKQFNSSGNTQVIVFYGPAHRRQFTLIYTANLTTGSVFGDMITWKETSQS